MAGIMLTSSVVSNNVFSLTGILEVSDKKHDAEMQENTAPEPKDNASPELQEWWYSNDSLAGTLPKYENNTADPLSQNITFEMPIPKPVE